MALVVLRGFLLNTFFCYPYRMLKLYNSLSRELEDFTPPKHGPVKVYSCGPTVYSRQHIGNMRAAIFVDILKRTLRYVGFEVKDVMNITDVGHLATDEGEGEDKMQKAAEKEGKDPFEVARIYERIYVEDLQKLNIDLPKHMPRATEHIQSQIDFIKVLEEKGFTYTTSDGVYFDTSKFADYGKLSGQSLEDKKAGARVEIRSEKKNGADFALWKFIVGEHANHAMAWNSPWGKGFPGWHIECSAMGEKYLGKVIDIHTGGIEHIPVHHENEIAQNTCSGKINEVRFWMHNEHLLLDGGKMSKSIGNVVTLDDITERGFNPLAFRYLMLTAHYRSTINFTWEALEGAGVALEKLESHVSEYLEVGVPNGVSVAHYSELFTEFVSDDLDTPKAVALLWKLIKDGSVSDADKKATVLDFDRVLGLGLENLKIEAIPANVTSIVEEREKAREAQNWAESDRLRDEITKLGYEVSDTDEGAKVKKV